MSFEARVKKIREINNNVKNGKFDFIPWKNYFPKLSQFVPGIMKGIMYKITANTAVGKSQFTKQAFVLNTYDYYLKTKKDIRIFYFALEESKEDFLDSMIVNRMYIKHNIELDILSLKGFKMPLSEDILNKIDETRTYFKEFFKVVTVIDSITEPSKIYAYVDKIAKDRGTLEFDDNGIFIKYTPKSKDEHLIIIADHVSLMSEEKNMHNNMFMNKHQTLSQWSYDYCRMGITKKYNYSVVNVQQQAASGESLDHYKSGKLEPTLEKLGDNKLTARDDFIVLGLFDPYRHGLKTYMGIDLLKHKDQFRMLSILKNRLGQAHKHIPLFFNGKVNLFKEIEVNK